MKSINRIGPAVHARDSILGHSQISQDFLAEYVKRERRSVTVRSLHILGPGDDVEGKFRDCQRIWFASIAKVNPVSK